MRTKDAIGLVWHYHHLHHALAPADAIWVLCSHDLRVADRAVELWKEGLAPFVAMSGGFGNFTEGVFERPEAELFAERAIQLGLPESKVLVEPRSTNCGENVAFTQALLAEKQISVSKVIAVQKPYMERRTYATIRKQWPELDVQVTSPQMSFEDYCSDSISPEMVVHIMVGDLQRIIEYPKRGFMIEQEISQEVEEAFQILIDAGYTKHLLADQLGRIPSGK
jgi:uncharacterized SAM-binding protein YcdF (DUF218 family)